MLREQSTILLFEFLYADSVKNWQRKRTVKYKKTTRKLPNEQVSWCSRGKLSGERIFDILNLSIEYQKKKERKKKPTIPNEYMTSDRKAGI